MNQQRLMKVLLGPHISEKASVAADKAGQYVFKVLTNASKTEIKQAVEMMFEVKVAAVQTALTKGKSKGSGPKQGRRSDWKKAYVKLQPGQKDIDFMGAQ